MLLFIKTGVNIGYGGGRFGCRRWELYSRLGLSELWVA